MSMKQACCPLHAGFLAYSSTLKMETVCSSKMLADFHQTAKRYIPEDRNLQEITCLLQNLRFIAVFTRACHRSQSSVS
jgi:hypothetical protein